MDRVDFETNEHLDSQAWSREEEMAHSKAVVERATMIAGELIVDIYNDGVADNLYNLRDEWRDLASFHVVDDVRKLSLDESAARNEAMNNLLKKLESLLIDQSIEKADQELRNESN